MGRQFDALELPAEDALPLEHELVLAARDVRVLDADPAAVGAPEGDRREGVVPGRCRISVTDAEDRTRKTEFVFERKGIFNWKLERIVLPTRRAPAPVAPAASHAPA